MILANKKVYDENCVYQLKDKTLVVLDGFNGESFRVSRIDAPENFWFEYEIFECSSEIVYGKISDAPVGLVDGEVYRFELNCMLRVGFYRESKDSFHTSLYCGYKICDAYEASQISKLVPEEK